MIKILLNSTQVSLIDRTVNSRGSYVGFLKDLQAKNGKVIYLGHDESAVYGYQASDPDCEVSAREFQLQYQKDIYVSSLRESGIRELDERLLLKRGKGRPASLSAYKIYKRDFLRRWTCFVTNRANQDGVRKSDLWTFFGFTSDVELRELRRGSDYSCRLSHSRFIKYFVPKVTKNGWSMMRRGNMTTLLNSNFMTHDEFVRWILARSETTNSPQLKLVSGAALN